MDFQAFLECSQSEVKHLIPKLGPFKRAMAALAKERGSFLVPYPVMPQDNIAPINVASVPCSTSSKDQIDETECQINEVKTEYLRGRGEDYSSWWGRM